jgi:hypothetical protein
VQDQKAAGGWPGSPPEGSARMYGIANGQEIGSLGRLGALLTRSGPSDESSPAPFSPNYVAGRSASWPVLPTGQFA